MITVGEWISQIRNQTKSVNQDNIYISDRLIYSLIKKHLSLFLYREDGKLKIGKMKFLYTVLPFVELTEVDKIEAQCVGITSGCTIKRTKEKLPDTLTGYTPLIGDVMSIDGSKIFVPTYPSTYVRKTQASDFKYNTTKYYWHINGYLYFPNIQWDAVKIELILDAIDIDECGDIDLCTRAQDVKIGVPEYLMSTVQAEVLKDIVFLIQAPKDNVQDKQSLT